jgi:hypothetical protein
LFSVGSFIAMIVHFCMFFAPLLSEDPWDLLSEARSYSCKDISVVQFLKHVWKSGWAESEDIAPYDVTYQSVVTREKNGEGVVNKGTYYTSYATNMVWVSISSPLARPHLPIYCSLVDGPRPRVDQRLHPKRFSFSQLPVIHPISGDVLLRSDQGPSVPGFRARYPEGERPRRAVQKRRGRARVLTVAPAILPVRHTSPWGKNNRGRQCLSNAHPFDLRETKCVHHRALTHPSDPVAGELVTGVWNVFTIEGATHASIVPRWSGSELQTTFFRGLGERLRFVEEKWTASRAA